jgi:hypothetical protein
MRAMGGKAGRHKPLWSSVNVGFFLPALPTFLRERGSPAALLASGKCFRKINWLERSELMGSGGSHSGFVGLKII